MGHHAIWILSCELLSHFLFWTKPGGLLVPKPMILCGSYPKSIASATFDQNFCQKKSTLLNVCNTFDKLVPKPIKLCGSYSKKISHQCHFWPEFPFRKNEKRHSKRFTPLLTNWTTCPHFWIYTLMWVFFMGKMCNSSLFSYLSLSDAVSLMFPSSSIAYLIRLCVLLSHPLGEKCDYLCREEKIGE